MHGRFQGDVTTEGDDTLVVNGHKIKVFSSRNPEEINWQDYDCDYRVKVLKFDIFSLTE